MSTKSLLRTLKVATQERANRKGTAAEEKFLFAMKSNDSLVQLQPWIQEVYLTEKWSDKDMEQIDAVVVTAAGPLHLQIKSSHRGARQHAAKVSERDARRNRIGVIVIREEDTVDQIRKSARAILHDLRAKLPQGAQAQIDD